MTETGKTTRGCTWLVSGAKIRKSNRSVRSRGTLCSLDDLSISNWLHDETPAKKQLISHHHFGAVASFAPGILAVFLFVKTFGETIK